MVELILQLLYECFSVFRKKQLTVFAVNFSEDRYLNLTAVFYAAKHIGIHSKFLLKKSSSPVAVLSALWTLAGARIIVVDCSHWIVSKVWISNKTHVVYLGHGGGAFKRMGFERPIAARLSNEKRMKLYGQFSEALSTSPECDERICANFRLSSEAVLKAGLPRTDALLAALREKPSVKPLPVLLFAPSFRESKSGRCYLWNFNAVNEVARRAGLTVWFSPHPDVPLPKGIPMGWVDCSSLSYVERIMRPAVLLTDRSSLMFDFSVTGKPVVLMEERASEDLWIAAKELEGVNLCRGYDELSVVLSSLQEAKPSRALFIQQMRRSRGNSAQVVAMRLAELINTNRHIRIKF